MVNVSPVPPSTMEISPAFSNRSRLTNDVLPSGCTVPPARFWNRSLSPAPAQSPKSLVRRASNVPPAWLMKRSSASSRMKPVMVPALKISMSPMPWWASIASSEPAEMDPVLMMVALEPA